MAKYIIKFEANWSDEFNCRQFILFEGDKTEIDSEIEAMVEFGGSFGTNQSFEAGDLTKDDFDVQEIPIEDYNLMVSLFPSKHYGTGIL